MKILYLILILLYVIIITAKNNIYEFIKNYIKFVKIS